LERSFPARAPLFSTFLFDPLLGSSPLGRFFSFFGNSAVLKGLHQAPVFLPPFLIRGFFPVGFREPVAECFLASPFFDLVLVMCRWPFAGMVLFFCLPPPRFVLRLSPPGPHLFGAVRPGEPKKILVGAFFSFRLPCGNPVPSFEKREKKLFPPLLFSFVITVNSPALSAFTVRLRRKTGPNRISGPTFPKFFFSPEGSVLQKFTEQGSVPCSAPSCVTLFPCEPFLLSPCSIKLRGVFSEHSLGVAFQFSPWHWDRAPFPLEDLQKRSFGASPIWYARARTSALWPI